MKCACVSSDVTPAPGIDQSGYLVREQPSLGVHDPICARALYLDDEEGGRLLWLHADVLAHERADVLGLKAILQDRHGLRPDEVLVTATHTHSGPAIIHLLNCGERDPVYLARLHEAFLSLAAWAITTAQPVSVHAGEGRSDLGMDRRGTANRHTDPRLPVLGFRREDGAWLAVLALYAMHNVAMGGENRQVSADVAGRAARTLSESLPGAPPVLWANGACGNINPPSVGPDFARMEAWGDALADTAAAALESARTVSSPRIRTALRELALAPGRLPDVDVERIVASVTERLGDPPSPFGRKHLTALASWRAFVMGEDPVHRLRCQAPVDVHAVALGDAVFVGVGGEVFSILNDDLRERTGKDVYVLGYANGDCGYICPETAYDEGGYEPDGAYVFYGTNPLPRGAFERVREAAADAVRSVTEIV